MAIIDLTVASEDSEGADVDEVGSVVSMDGREEWEQDGEQDGVRMVKAEDTVHAVGILVRKEREEEVTVEADGTEVAKRKRLSPVALGPPRPLNP